MGRKAGTRAGAGTRVLPGRKSQEYRVSRGKRNRNANPKRGGKVAAEEPNLGTPRSYDDAQRDRVIAALAGDPECNLSRVARTVGISRAAAQRIADRWREHGDGTRAVSVSPISDALRASSIANTEGESDASSSHEQPIGNPNRRSAQDPRDGMRRAALAAVSVKQRIRVLKRMIRSSDDQVALRALAMLNELSGIAPRKDEVSVPDSRPLFGLPAQSDVAVTVKSDPE